MQHPAQPFVQTVAVWPQCNTLSRSPHVFPACAMPQLTLHAAVLIAHCAVHCATSTHYQRE